MAGIGGKGDIDRNLFTLWDFLRGSLSGRHLFLLSLFLLLLMWKGWVWGARGGNGHCFFLYNLVGRGFMCGFCGGLFKAGGHERNFSLARQTKKKTIFAHLFSLPLHPLSTLSSYFCNLSLCFFNTALLWILIFTSHLSKLWLYCIYNLSSLFSLLSFLLIPISGRLAGGGIRKIWSSVHLVFASRRSVITLCSVSVRLDESIQQGTHSHHHPSSSRTVSGMAWHIQNPPD